VGAAASLVLLIAYNATVTLPVSHALSDEQEATVIAYRRWLVSPNQIVFDVRRVSDTASMADVDRMLFKAADALESRQFEQVILASNGAARLALDGQHFRRIGEEWPDQNPIYLIRMLPENVRNLDGTEAFGQWQGGWLGVLGKQIEDHNEVHLRWYVRPLLGLADPANAPPADYSEAP
jgi:hypothetical protein